MLDKNNYRKQLHEFSCFSIAGYDLRSVCCEREFVLQCDSDYELYIIYNKLLKQKRLPPSKTYIYSVNTQSYIGWLSKSCTCDWFIKIGNKSNYISKNVINLLHTSALVVELPKSIVCVVPFVIVKVTTFVELIEYSMQ